MKEAAATNGNPTWNAVCDGTTQWTIVLTADQSASVTAPAPSRSGKLSGDSTVTVRGGRASSASQGPPDRRRSAPAPCGTARIVGDGGEQGQRRTQLHRIDRAEDRLGRSGAAIAAATASMRRGPSNGCADRPALPGIGDGIEYRRRAAAQPAICGKTYHIQWLCFRPDRSSASAVAKLFDWASTKRTSAASWGLRG